MSTNISSQTIITEVPFGFSGRVWRSCMPFGSMDPDGRVWLRYQRKAVSVVVVLASLEECLRCSGRDLLTFYRRQGLELIHLPIADFGIPAHGDLERAVRAALEKASAGNNIAVHCNAGIGRTGMFLACLAILGLGISAQESIPWVRQFIPQAIETPEQEKTVLAFEHLVRL